jgi:hypothetical protein
MNWLVFPESKLLLGVYLHRWQQFLKGHHHAINSGDRLNL